MTDVFLGLFDTDLDAPTIVNLFPVAAAINVAPTATITFDILDDTGVDTNNTQIYLDGVLTFNLGAQQPGYTVTTTPIVGGVHFTLNKTGNLSEATLHTVLINTQDTVVPPNIVVGFSWSFTTADVTAPVVSNKFPAAAATNVTPNLTITFDVTDASSIDLSATSFLVDGVFAYNAGAPQNSYTVVITPIVGGRHFSVTVPVPLTQYALHSVVFNTQDTASPPNQLVGYSWSFTTADVTAPTVTNRNPAPAAVSVPVAQPIAMDIVDTIGPGVDLTTVIIVVGGVTAFQTSTGQNGYIATVTPIVTGYTISLAHPNLAFNTAYLVQVNASDLAVPPNAMTQVNYTFTTGIPTTTARAPYLTAITPIPGTFGAPVNTNISFQIRTDVGASITASSVNIFFNGLLIWSANTSLQPSLYGVTVTPIAQGQQVVINPVQDLGVQVHRIDANGIDNLATYGEGYFEFSTDTFSYTLQLSAQTPLDCPYDLLPDPFLVTNTDVTEDRFVGKFTSPTMYWSAKGTVPTDTLRVSAGVASGDFIMRNAVNTDVFTYEKPRASTTFSGTVALTPASATVTGTGTLFRAEVAAGYLVRFGTNTTTYQVQTVVSNTSLVLTTPYAGSSPLTLVIMTNATLSSIGGFKRRKFSSVNPARTTANSSVTYPFMKLWGSTRMRYLAGYPSAVGFPVPFTIQPIAIIYTRVDVGNVGVIDDLAMRAPTVVPVSKQKYLSFSISSNTVSGGNYDRYALSFAVVNPVQIGARTLVQFSIASMDPNAEVYFGLGANTLQPSSDGTNRSGVTLRRVPTGSSDKIQVILYHGTATTPLTNTVINYADFINKLWLCELEVVAVGSTKFSLYEFGKDLTVPAYSQTILGGGSTIADNFSVVSFGNTHVLLGARVKGSVYYVDVELNPSVGGPYLPFALAGDVTLSDAKWRPYANVMPMTFTPEQGLKTIQSKCSMLPFGTESAVVIERHVLDTESTFSTIDSVKPETLVEVLEAEDPTIDDPESPNANIYRRASLLYETLDETSGILFMSKAGGPTGNQKSVEIIQPPASTPFGIVVTGDHMAITLATNIGGNITTTVQNIVDAIEATPSYALDAIPAGITGHVAEKLENVFLYGGAAYKVSDSPRFNELTLSFRANKTGTYYLSMADSTVFGMFGGAVLLADGTLTVGTPIFQPTDVGKVVSITNALIPTNVGAYTIVAVINGASYQYPTNIVMLSRKDFTTESNTFTWNVQSRGYLLMAGPYTRTSNPQKIALLTNDFNNLSDGKRTLNITVCKNMLITAGALLEADSSLDLQN